MLDFFQSIINYINVGFSFLLNIINGLLQVFKLIPNILLFVTTNSAYIPSFLVPFFLAGITLSIVLVIIGRRS